MTQQFVHRALSLQEKKLIIFTALSKRYFYMRMLIVAHVLKQGGVPLNPFMSFDYFLADTVDRDLIRNANNNLLDLADELWVFGAISNGVMAEMQQAKIQGKTIRFFSILNDREFFEVTKDELVFEDGMEKYKKEI